MKGGLSLLTKKEISYIMENSYFFENLEKNDYVSLKSIINGNQIWTKDSLLGKVVTFRLSDEDDIYKPFINISPNNIHVGVLPVIRDKELYEELNALFKDADEIEMYEFPSNVADKKIFDELTLLYNSGDLEQTGRYFDGDTEYYYKGNKYILASSSYYITAKNGRKISENDEVWIKVEPIKWVNIKEKKIFVCKNILCGNMTFNKMPYTGIFNHTHMYQILQNMYDQMKCKLKNEDLFLSHNDVNNPLNFRYLTFNNLNGITQTPIMRDYLTARTDFAEALGCNGLFYPRYGAPSIDGTDVGYLPVIDYSLIKDECEVINVDKKILKAYFGEYPQNKLTNSELIELKKIVDNSELKTFETGKRYSVPARYVNSDNEKEQYGSNRIIQINEYEINDQKYVTLGNDKWFKVQKVLFIVDLKCDLAICPNILFAGLYFNPEKEFITSDFNKFVTKCFSKDIVPSKSRNKKIIETVSNDIVAQMLMNKQNISIDDLDLNGDSKLVLRR